MKLLIVSVLVIVVAVAVLIMFTNMDDLASDTLSSVKVTNPLQTYEINTEEELLCHASYTDFLGNFNNKIYALGSEGMKQKYPLMVETVQKISGGSYSISTQQDEEIARELLGELFMNEMSINPAIKSSLNYIFTDSFTLRYTKIGQLSPDQSKCYSILNLEISNKPPNLTKSNLENSLPKLSTADQQVVDVLMGYSGPNDSGLTVMEAISMKISEEYRNEKIYDNGKTKVEITVSKLSSEKYHVIFNFESHKGVMNYDWNVNTSSGKISSNNPDSKYLIDMVDFYD